MLRVRKSKTATGVCEIDLTPALREELATLKASRTRPAPHFEDVPEAWISVPPLAAAT